MSLMITTHNREADLRRTLFELAKLDPQPDEILICADGCTDRTVDMIKTEFSYCRLLENANRQGSVFSRDRLLRAASADFVISLDDDSYPIATDFVERVADLFELHPNVGVFSFAEIRGDGEVASEGCRSAGARLVSAYANCAAAMRKELYLRSAGFPIFFGHMYEEPDYALQCYSLGYAVQLEPDIYIRHHLSGAQRQPMNRHHLNARNELWSVVLRCPFPQILAVLPFRIWRQFAYALSEGGQWAQNEWRWWMAALKGFGRCWKHRRPVPWSLYYRWMKLSRSPAMPVE